MYGMAHSHYLKLKVTRSFLFEKRVVRDKKKKKKKKKKEREKKA